MPHPPFPSRLRHAAPALVAALAFVAAGGVHAQLVNYGAPLAAYKDQRDSGVRLLDSVTPGVAAKSTVNRALLRSQVTDQQALVQPDGTLKLPADQTNLVIRTNYNNVTQGADGTVRIASPNIQGNVTGNVTLFVDGKGVENITVLNNGR